MVPGRVSNHIKPRRPTTGPRKKSPSLWAWERNGLTLRAVLAILLNEMPVKFSVIIGTELREAGSNETAGAAAMDWIAFRRLLDLNDVAQVREWLGPKAGWQRWRTQTRLFRQFHAGLGRKGLRLARARMRENSCPLDRQLRDASEFLWLWAKIAAMASLHYAGVPLETELRRAFQRMLASGPLADQALIRQPHGA